jgi:Domain of unknown function (DUF4372)
MVQAGSLFNQLLDHFPKLEFGALVRKHEADKGAKGFSSWTQCVAMLFCQLARADSLREICNGLACSQGKLIHLGIAQAPNKSTLSYANEHRPAGLFEDLFWATLKRFREQQASAGERPSSVSATSCCRWIPPPSRCAWGYFPGPSSGAPKAA